MDLIVTSRMELSTYGQQIYKMDDIIVTGNHKVLYNDEWIDVKLHPSSIEVDDYESSIHILFKYE